MADLNLDIHYFDHIKTRRLVKALGPTADVYPIRLWCYAARHCPATGIFKGMSAHELETELGWDGEAGELIDMLVQLSFLRRATSFYRIHSWAQHNGHLTAFAKRASKAANARWAKQREREKNHAQASPSNARAMPQPTQPNPTNPTQPTGVQGGNAALGVGEGKGGKNGKHPPPGDLADATRQVEVQSLLARAHVNPEVVRKFMIRKDITAERINRELADIDRDAGVGDRAGVLVSRLNRRGE